MGLPGSRVGIRGESGESIALTEPAPSPGVENLNGRVARVRSRTRVEGVAGLLTLGVTERTRGALTEGLAGLLERRRAADVRGALVGLLERRTAPEDRVPDRGALDERLTEPDDRELERLGADARGELPPPEPEDAVELPLELLPLSRLGLSAWSSGASNRTALNMATLVSHRVVSIFMVRLLFRPHPVLPTSVQASDVMIPQDVLPQSGRPN